MTESEQNKQGQGGLGGALGKVTDTAGQAVGKVGQAAKGLASGATHLLSETTSAAGHTVQRTVDESGNIVEYTLDESRNVLSENLAGNVTDLPVEEEHVDEEGRIVRTVRDESWKLLHLTIGPDGYILDLKLPDPGDTVEEVREKEPSLEEHSQTVVEEGTVEEEDPDDTEGAKQEAE